MTNKKLPTSLGELSETKIPTAPENREPYSYSETSEGFELCATFSQPSTESNDMMAPSMFDTAVMQVKNPDNWQHEAGKICFNRVVNKEPVGTKG
jgi:hypothetical protein